MTRIILNQLLERDTIVLGYLNNQLLLLMNNALVPWFILVPDSDEIELFKLESEEKLTLFKNVDLLSALILSHFESEKLNVATIGNLVSQLHIHIIGRHKEDFCWPGVVWGTTRKEPYQQFNVDNLVKLLQQQFGNIFIPHSSYIAQTETKPI